jgi:hypothetical protein
VIRSVKNWVLSAWRNASCFLRILATPSYARYAFRWLRSIRSESNFSDPEPWVTFEAIDFFAELSLSEKNVFEYGSGSSTLYWLKRGALCVSIEHDGQWYERLKKLLKGDSRIDYRFVPPEQRGDVQSPDFADPDLFLSSDRDYSGVDFRKYVTQIDEFPDEFFDVVLVDGRARPSCVKRSYRKVKLGGVLVLDNSDREYYLRRTIDLLSGFTRIDFRGPTPGSHVFSETSVFTRVS